MKNKPNDWLAYASEALTMNDGVVPPQHTKPIYQFTRKEAKQKQHQKTRRKIARKSRKINRR